MERSVTRSGPCSFGGLSKAEKVVEQNKELVEELAAEMGIGNLTRYQYHAPRKGSFANITSRSRRSGLVRNFAKKYSFELVSSSGSRFRFNVAAAPALLRLPIIARSFAVASLMKGIILLTASLNSSKKAGLLAKTVGLEKGS